MEHAASASRPRADDAFEVAPHWRRLFAYVIDACTLVVPTTILGAAVVFLSVDDLSSLLTRQSDGTLGFRPGGAEELTSAVTNALIAGLILQFLYFTAFTCLTGETPGKRIMDITVIGRDGRLLPGSVLVRYLVLFGPGVAGLLLSWLYPAREAAATILGLLVCPVLLWSLVDGASRGLHDLAAGTAVVSSVRIEPPPREMPSFGGGPIRSW